MDHTDMEALRRRSKRIWNYLGIALIVAGVTSPIGIFLLLGNMLGLLPAMGKVAAPGSRNDLPGKKNKPRANPPGAKVPGRETLAESLLSPIAWLKAIIEVFGLFCLCPALFFLVVFFITRESIHFYLLLFFTGGVLCLFWVRNSASLGIRKRARFKAYLRLIGDRQTLPIQYLADQMGLNYDRVVKDLREMIRRGYLPPHWLE